MARFDHSLRPRWPKATQPPSSPLLPSSDNDLSRPIPMADQLKHKKMTQFTKNIFYLSIFLFIYLFFLYSPKSIGDHDPVGHDSHGDHALDVKFLTLVINVTVYPGFRPIDTPHHGLLLRKNRIIRIFDTVEETLRTSNSLGSMTGVRIIDGHGATVLPGLIDSHGHLVEYGLALDQPDLSHATSLAEIRTLLHNYLSHFPSDHFSTSSLRWLRAHGWDQTKYSMINNSLPASKDLDMDPILSSIPIVLQRIDVHAYWVNDVVLALIGTSIPKTNPVGGVIVRDPISGEPTGVFIDSAMAFVDAIMPPPSSADIMAAVHRAQTHLLKLGLTGIHIAGILPPAMKVLQTMDNDGDLKIRTYAMARCPHSSGPDHISASEPIVCLEAYPNKFKGKLLSMQAIKLYIDGALGSYGAALLQPYSDQPSNRGTIFCSQWTCPELHMVLSNWTQNGWQVAIHAIGDHANRIAVKAVIDAGITKEQRPRIEHAQIVHPDDIKLMAQHSIIASMQPVQATSDMWYAESRLGPERLSHIYPWHDMITNGIVALALGSDFPVESPNPLLGVYSSESVTDRNGNSPQGQGKPWRQGLHRSISLRGYTEWAAYAGKMEKKVGRLDPGMIADMTIVDKDIVQQGGVAIDSILDVQVIATVVDGILRYVRDEDKSRWQDLNQW